MANLTLNHGKQQLFVIWTKRTDGWFPSKPMTQAVVNKLSAEFAEQGKIFRVASKPGTTIADILE